jgi:cytochrome bd-type quinol oxidase subunit 2
MNQITTSQREKEQNPLRILQVIFTWLAFFFLVLGSVIIGLTWLESGGPSSSNNYEIGFIAVVVFAAVTLVVVWLFSTIALALAKQWIAAVLALPAAPVLFYASFLLLALTMNMPANSGTTLVLSLVLLNGVALLLAIFFLKRTAFYKQNREKTNAR